MVEAANRLGGIDILVNNAGIGAQGGVEDNDDDEWRRVFDVNVFGMVRASRSALPYLRASRAAAIVNTCSIAATAGLPQRVLYASTKGAVLSMTQAMAADLVTRASASTASTRHADTPWVNRPAGDRRRPRRGTPRRSPPASRWAVWSRRTRWPRPSRYLASPLAGSTTGTTLAVDGGMHDLRLRPSTGKEQP